MEYLFTYLVIAVLVGAAMAAIVYAVLYVMGEIGN